MKDKSPSHEYLEAKCKAKFEEMNALKSVEKWLENNPPPKDWQAGRYAWAWAEMPIYFLKKNGVFMIIDSNEVVTISIVTELGNILIEVRGGYIGATEIINTYIETNRTALEKLNYKIIIS